MQTFFSKAIYLQTIRRYWAGSALLAIILTINAFAINNSQYWSGDFPNDSRFSLINEPAALLVIMFASAVCALLIFSYMQDKRGTIMFHSLPVRREAFFFSTFLGGMTLIWAPGLLFFFKVTLMQLIPGNFDIATALLWLAFTLLASLLGFSLTMFAGQLTGQIFSQILVIGMLLGVPFALAAFFEMHAQAFLLGYGGSAFEVIITYNPIFYLVPILESSSLLFSDPEFTHFGAIDYFHIFGLLVFVAGLFIASLFLYKRRKLELAGEFIAYRGMRPVFLFCAAFLAAFLFEVIAMAISEHPVGMVIFGAIGGLIGYIAAQMLIRGTVKVFKRLKGALVFAGCFVLVFLSFQFDFFGYARFTPQADRVESVEFRENNIFWHWGDNWDDIPHPYDFTEQEQIEAALALHRAIVENRVSLDNINTSFSRNRAWHFDDGDEDNFPLFHHFNFTFTLDSGRRIERRYSILVPRDLPIEYYVGRLEAVALPNIIETLRNLGEASDVIRLFQVRHPFADGESNWDVGILYDGDYEVYSGPARDAPAPDYFVQDFPIDSPDSDDSPHNITIPKRHIRDFVEAIIRDYEAGHFLHHWSENDMFTAHFEQNIPIEPHPSPRRMEHWHQPIHPFVLHITEERENTWEWLIRNGYILNVEGYGGFDDFVILSPFRS